MVALVGCISAPPPPDGRGRSWQELPDADQPGRLRDVDLAYDRTQKRVVLHGGVDDGGDAMNMTWALDEVQGRWDRICTASSPPPLHAPALAFDSRAERLVLVGGSTTADLMTPTNEVWTCDSATGLGWVLSGTMPISVAAAQLVDDRGRDALLLVGGEGNMGTVGGDVYSSTDLVMWQALGIAAPTPFGGSATTATYDRVAQRVLALKNFTEPFGSQPEPTDELWALERDLDRWSLVCGDCSGDPRSEAAIVHIDTSNDLYVIGGLGPGRREYAGAWVLDNDKLLKAHDKPSARDRVSAAYNEDRQSVVVYGGNSPGCEGNCGTTWLMTLD
jgi:hypothetical protein